MSLGRVFQPYRSFGANWRRPEQESRTALRVAVEAPQHSGISATLDYQSDTIAGTRDAGAGAARPAPGHGHRLASDRAPMRPTHPRSGRSSRSTQSLGALPPLPPDWLKLVDFTAAYYQRGIGEVALAVLPPELRRLDDEQLHRRVDRLRSSCRTEQKPRARHRPAERQRGTATGARAARSLFRGERLRRRLGHRAAARQHRQRQDRGLPARSGAGAAARPAGAGAGARDQPDAAARGALCRALRRAGRSFRCTAA